MMEIMKTIGLILITVSLTLIVEKYWKKYKQHRAVKKKQEMASIKAIIRTEVRSYLEQLQK